MALVDPENLKKEQGWTPTARMRWLRKSGEVLLQQRWEHLARGMFEWRDVDVVTE